MCIYIYNIEQESRNTKNTYDFSVQVRNILLPLSLKVFRRNERESTIFLFWLFHRPTPFCATPAQGLREQAKVNRLVWCLVSTLLTSFKFPKSSARFRCVTSFTLFNPVSHLGLLWHLWLARPVRPHVGAWTPMLMLRLSNPCTVPKGSQPN